MNVEIVGAGADLVEAAAERLGEPGPDMADRLAVFPGRRPGHFLLRRLAEGIGGGFIPPRILSLDEFVDMVFEARLPSARPRIEAVDAVALLFGIQREGERSLGGERFLSLDAFLPLGMRIFDDLEDLLAEGVDPSRVKEVQTLIEERIPLHSRERLAAMAHFYEEFYPEVENRGLSTRAQRSRAVASSLSAEDLRGFRRIVCAGFFRPNAAEREILRRLSDAPGAVLLMQEGPGVGKAFDAFGVPRGARGGGGRALPAAPRIRLHKSPDTHGQAFALGPLLGEPDGRTVIVLPAAETLFPLLRHCLSRFDGQSYNVSLGYPLARTPMFGFFADLMELVLSMDGDRVYVPSYLTFLLHPYAKNVLLGDSAEATRVLLHALEKRLAAGRSRTFLPLSEIEDATEVFREAEKTLAEDGRGPTAADLKAHLSSIHGATIGRFRAFRDVLDFAERCIGIVEWIHGRSTARLHPYFTPFCESFLRSLDALARSLLAPMAFEGAAGYFSLLRRYVRTCRLPFEGTPLAGLQVLGAMETRDIAFRRVFVLDANEGSLPESGGDDSLLPLPVRKALGLATRREREEAADYHFGRLLACAREVHIFFVEGGGNERSRFVERLLWDAQRRDGNLAEGAHIGTVRYRADLSDRPPRPVRKDGRVLGILEAFRFTATSLDAYLACPLRFYYGHVLRLSEKEEVSGEIERADIGIHVHDLFRAYLSPLVGRPLTERDADRSVMARLVAQAFSYRFGPSENGAGRLLFRQLTGHLGDFLEDYLAPIARGGRLEVLAVERRIEKAWKGFTLSGRLDAVLRRDACHWIVDWKTGHDRKRYACRPDALQPGDRSGWAHCLPTLQLPFYVLLYSLETGIAVKDLRASFLLLGRTVMDGDIEVPLFRDNGEAEAWPAVVETLEGLLREIVSPDVPFGPAEDLASACPRCPFTGICGTRRFLRA